MQRTFVCWRLCQLGVAFITLAVCVPAAKESGSPPKALGTVEQANHARVRGGSAVSGTAVYAGDAVQTDNHGTVRLRLGTGKLYLSASSSASVEERAGLATVTLAKGSAAFSLPDPTQFELETPAGTLRGSGMKATRGQVSITGANEIVVSASEGALVLDNDGELYTIAQGKAYRIIITARAESGGDHNSQTAADNGQHPKRKLLFFPVRPMNAA